MDTWATTSCSTLYRPALPVPVWRRDVILGWRSPKLLLITWARHHCRQYFLYTAKKRNTNLYYKMLILVIPFSNSGEGNKVCIFFSKGRAARQQWRLMITSSPTWCTHTLTQELQVGMRLWSASMRFLQSRLHQRQCACKGKPGRVWGPAAEPSRTGTSLSRSLRGMPNWLLRDNKSPSDVQPARREDETLQSWNVTVTTETGGTLQRLESAALSEDQCMFNLLSRSVLK